MERRVSYVPLLDAAVTNNDEAKTVGCFMSINLDFTLFCGHTPLLDHAKGLQKNYNISSNTNCWMLTLKSVIHSSVPSIDPDGKSPNFAPVLDYQELVVHIIMLVTLIGVDQGIMICPN